MQYTQHADPDCNRNGCNHLVRMSFTSICTQQTVFCNVKKKQKHINLKLIDCKGTFSIFFVGQIPTGFLGDFRENKNKSQFCFLVMDNFISSEDSPNKEYTEGDLTKTSLFWTV